MKKAVFIAILVFFLIADLFCALAAEDKKVGFELTLKDAILIAFKNNKDIQIQQKELDVAKADILDARSRFLPEVNLDASYTFNDKIWVENIFAGFRNDNQLGVSLSESVYNGGADIANFKQAKLGFRVQEETLRAKKLDVEFDAKRLYYGLLLAYETERIANELVTQAEAHYRDVRHKFEQGTTSRFDVLQSKVQVSLLMPELVKARNSVTLIIAELNKLLGQKIDIPLEPQEKLGCAHIEITEAEFLKVAYLNKPEMILKSLGIDISKWSIQMAKAGYRPQVDISTGYDYRSNNTANMINGKHSNWNAGVSVTIPIFDGFSSKAKVDAAKANYAQALLDKENLSEQIAVDIRRACLDLNQAETIINSQKEDVDKAKEALRISEVSYDNGVGTNLDVLDSIVSLGQIQQNLAEGIYDYIMAQASLDRTMGNGYIEP